MQLDGKANEKEGRLVELASGVDALYLSGRASLPGGLITRLVAGREAAEEVEGSMPFDLGGESFDFAPHGFGKYRYCLKHRNGQVGLTPSTAIPAIRIQPRAEFLHGLGPRSAIAWFAQILEREVGPLLLSVSRVDLFADVQGWALSGDDRWRFVCRADKHATHEDGQEFNGLSFGRRTSKTITARIYDKSIEVREKGTDYWFELWGDAHDPSRPVIRVEFEFLRAALREFGLASPDDVLDSAGALWASATENWLSYRCPTADQTRSRWPVAPEWQAIMRVSVRQEAGGLDRVYAARSAGTLRKMLPQLNGWVVSYAVLIGATDIEGACSELARSLRSYGREKGYSFSSQVVARQREMGTR